MSVVIVTKTTGDRHTIRFQYNPTLVDMIKAVVPSYGRSYDPQTKIWSVDGSWLQTFTDTAVAAGHTVNVIEPPKPQLPPAPPPPPPVDSWAVTLLRRCGTAELRQNVYRNLSKALHADLGGDHALQQELNDARDEINKKNGAVS